MTGNEDDIRWTDASIRWPEDKVVSILDGDDDINGPVFDIFADDPHEIFNFRFVTKEVNSTITNTIQLNIHGYKTDSDEVWQSTGLTLWKASKYLCHYMCEHVDELQNQRVLELGAGLGLNGILAHRLAPNSSVVVTDGDSDAMALLRKNIVINQSIPIGDDDDKVESNDGTQQSKIAIDSRQLIWGLTPASKFLDVLSSSSSSSSSKFSVIIASDVIYASVVIVPLWETVQKLLTPEGVFWLAFAKRKVPVTIEFVLQKAQDYGFSYELVGKNEDGECNDDNKNSKIDTTEAGPVFIYIFRWDTAETSHCEGETVVV
mmetsp:Transcript_56664/g.63343  ORF Transcript_56664/g.63343 Transcript_56664/m.63343 type:complete len:318 (+) Transcript_56664:58-1011(+)